jgi:hypothetical protein
MRNEVKLRIYVPLKLVFCAVVHETQPFRLVLVNAVSDGWMVGDLPDQ